MTRTPLAAAAPPQASRRPLVAARVPAVTAVGVAVACFAALAAWVHDTRDPEPIDREVSEWLARHIGTTVQQATLGLTDPVLTTGICAAVALTALLARRPAVAALAVIGPLAGLLLESYVLKPGIGRLIGTIEANYAFPSGHETGVTSAAFLLALLVVRSTWSRLVKSIVLAVVTVWTAVAALALVRSHYHYFTDTVGGVLLGVVVMLTTALLIDLVVARVSSPAGRDRTRTARGA